VNMDTSPPMSGSGTKRTYRVRNVMSAFEGKAENICSHGAFPVLDPERTLGRSNFQSSARR
jgi:hypothetical protein